MHFSHMGPQNGVPGAGLGPHFGAPFGAQITLTAVWEPNALYGLGPSNGVPPIRGTPRSWGPGIWAPWAMGPYPSSLATGIRGTGPTAHTPLVRCMGCGAWDNSSMIP